jgi:ribosomal protein S27AE
MALFNISKSRNQSGNSLTGANRPTDISSGCTISNGKLRAARLPFCAQQRCGSGTALNDHVNRLIWYGACWDCATPFSDRHNPVGKMPEGKSFSATARRRKNHSTPWGLIIAAGMQGSDHRKAGHSPG